MAIFVTRMVVMANMMKMAIMANMKYCELASNKVYMGVSGDKFKNLRLGLGLSLATGGLSYSLGPV